jgi:hypothetical protein
MSQIESNLMRKCNAVQIQAGQLQPLRDGDGG